jgi:hypothetical protein
MPARAFSILIDGGHQSDVWLADGVHPDTDHLHRDFLLKIVDAGRPIHYRHTSAPYLGRDSIMADHSPDHRRGRRGECDRLFEKHTSFIVGRKQTLHFAPKVRVPGNLIEIRADLPEQARAPRKEPV